MKSYWNKHIFNKITVRCSALSTFENAGNVWSTSTPTWVNVCQPVRRHGSMCGQSVRRRGSMCVNQYADVGKCVVNQYADVGQCCNYCHFLWQVFLAKIPSSVRNHLNQAFCFTIFILTHSQPYNKMFIFNVKSHHCNSAVTDDQFTPLYKEYLTNRQIIFRHIQYNINSLRYIC